MLKWLKKGSNTVQRNAKVFEKKEVTQGHFKDNSTIMAFDEQRRWFVSHRHFQTVSKATIVKSHFPAKVQ